MFNPCFVALIIFGVTVSNGEVTTDIQVFFPTSRKLLQMLTDVEKTEIKPVLSQLDKLEKDLISIPLMVRDLEQEIQQEINEKIKNLTKQIEQDDKSEPTKREKSDKDAVNVPKVLSAQKLACLQGIKDELNGILEDLRIEECFSHISIEAALASAKTAARTATWMGQRMDEFRMFPTTLTVVDDIRDFLIARPNLKVDLADIRRYADKTVIRQCADFKKHLKLAHVKHLNLTRLSCLA